MSTSRAITLHSREPLLLVVSGPAASGKTTLCTHLLRTFSNLRRVVTATTREPRGNEIDGEDYHFLTRTVFTRGIAAGEFLEHAQVHGNLYGIPWKEVTAGDADLVLNIDVQGAQTLRARAAADSSLASRLVTVFVCPPTLAVLEERIRSRGRDPEAEIRERLATAREEIREAGEYDYLILSGRREEDAAAIEAIYRAEVRRTKRCLSDFNSGFERLA